MTRNDRVNLNYVQYTIKSTHHNRSENLKQEKTGFNLFLNKPTVVPTARPIQLIVFVWEAMVVQHRGQMDRMNVIMNFHLNKTGLF